MENQDRLNDLAHALLDAYHHLWAVQAARLTIAQRKIRKRHAEYAVNAADAALARALFVHLEDDRPLTRKERLEWARGCCDTADER